MKHFLVLLSFFVSYCCSYCSDTIDGMTIINHIPQTEKKYIGSPCLCVLDDGTYLASHDVFGPKSNSHMSGEVHIFSSKDQGKTWKQISVIKGQYWSSLFTLNGKLYIMGPNREHGSIVIRASEDNGYTWTTPYLAENGIILPGEYHTASMPFLFYKGRIWRAVEYASAPTTKWPSRYSAMVISASVKDDLLNAKNWRKTNFIMRQPDWLDGNFAGWLEGQVLVTPKGDLVNFLRVDAPKTDNEYAASVHISKNGKKATFDPLTGFTKMPGGSKKFDIHYDSVSQRYLTLTNYVTSDYKGKNLNFAFVRNTLALCSSSDLKNWTVHKIIIQHPDHKKHGFQYTSWLFDKNDIIMVIRTADDDENGGANTAHNSNYLTFYRLKNFRNLLEQCVEVFK